MPSYSRRVQIPGKTSQELYHLVSESIDVFLSKAPALGKYELERDPKLFQVRLKSSIFTACLTCKDAELELDGQLSFLATPFKSKLDDGITKWISKTFQNG